MKVTFVSPYYSNVWEPLGIGYLIAYCRRTFPHAQFTFCHGNFDDNATILQHCLSSDIVAFSATSPTYKEALRLAKIIKESDPRIRTVLGGWHATVTCYTEEFPYIDDIICGEGEQAMKLILEENHMLEDWLSRTLLTFDELPWPDRMTTKQERHLDLCYKMCGLRIASFQSRRGCPMNCAFCGEHLMSNHNIRVRDPEDVLDEINKVYLEYNIDMFKFVDPTWCHPRTAAWEFCEAKLRRNNHLPWEAMGHAAFLTKDMLEIMKRANCKQINIGVESGSQELLNAMHKGVTVDKIKKVFKWCHEIDLEVRGFFLIGMPGETLKTAEQTFNLVKEIQPDVFGMTILCPYPGSEFYDPEKHKNVDWSKADEYSNDFWETPRLCNDDLKRIQRVFMKAFKDKIAPHMKEVVGNNK